MKQLVRLDLERIRRNLEAATAAPQTHDDVLRLLAVRKVWRKDEHWFIADEAAVRMFSQGEVVEKRSAE